MQGIPYLVNSKYKSSAAAQFFVVYIALLGINSILLLNLQVINIIISSFSFDNSNASIKFIEIVWKGILGVRINYNNF